jgi:hypothetical protein
MKFLVIVMIQLYYVENVFDYLNWTTSHCSPLPLVLHSLSRSLQCPRPRLLRRHDRWTHSPGSLESQSINISSLSLRRDALSVADHLQRANVH